MVASGVRQEAKTWRREEVGCFTKDHSDRLGAAYRQGREGKREKDSGVGGEKRSRCRVESGEWKGVNIGNNSSRAELIIRGPEIRYWRSQKIDCIDQREISRS